MFNSQFWTLARVTAPALRRTFVAAHASAAEGDTGAPRSGGSASRYVYPATIWTPKTI
jgi:hypothetical protein